MLFRFQTGIVAALPSPYDCQTRKLINTYTMPLLRGQYIIAMPDMLVKLYELPPIESLLAQHAANGVDIRRALPPEKHVIIPWIKEHFNPRWVSECEVAIARKPATCFVAIENGNLLGFACYDVVRPNIFGPTGVHDSQRGRGLGKVLLLACLHNMAAQGYAYAIIGGVGPADFYHKVVGAVEIEGSTPGIYRGML